MAKHEKRIIRLLPCPSYDIEGLQTYFESMASEGLHVKKDGIFAGFAAFERGEAYSVRYRMDMEERRGGILGDNNGRPDADKIALCKELGWEYVDSWNGTHIYRCEDSSAQELNTDAKVRSIALKRIVKDQLVNVAVLCFWLLVYPILRLSGLILPTMFAIGSDLMLLLMALVLSDIAFEIKKLIMLHKIKRRLNDGESIANRVRRRGAAYIVPRVIFALATALAACMFLIRWSDDAAGKNEIPLCEYTEELPFATIADIVDGEYRNENFLNSDRVERHSDLFADDIIKYRETASVKLSDGTEFSGGLMADYYSVANEGLARATARELARAASLKKNYEVIPLDDMGADYQIAYYDNAHTPTVIFQKGSIVIKALLYQTGSYTVSIEEWAAELIKQCR